MTKIEWTDVVWNPVTGCDKVSLGCRNCYAEAFAKRLQAMGCAKYADGFKVTLHPDVLNLPKKWRKPKRIFVNSMSDLFHADVPTAFIQDVFKVMNECERHTFQILTKRPERLSEINELVEWTNNIWMGVTVENNAVYERIDLLRACDSSVKFLSCEPLISSLDGINLNGIDWVIVGGESGKNAREMKEEWVAELYANCFEERIPFFFKQWSGKANIESPLNDIKQFP